MRNAFSSAEDERLVEYIAKNNPTMGGRQGKVLYQRLADNSWAQSHPWQSWRERYKKHMDIFDRKIARYLKEGKSAAPKPAKKAPDATTIEKNETEENKPVLQLDDDGDRLFGSNVKEEGEGEKEAHQDKPPSSSAMPTSASPMCDIRDTSIIGKGTAMAEGFIPQRPPIPSQVARGLKRKIHDEDPFDNTPAASPHPAGRALDLRGPPLLKEGPFRNTYLPSRRKIEDDGVAWPPKRRRKNEEQLEGTPSGPSEQSSATFSAHINRHIDLREEKLRRSSLRNSIASSRSSTTSTSKYPRRHESAVSAGSRHSRHSIVSPEDAQLIQILKQELAALGKKNGFPLDVVEATFKDTGSLEKTRSVLEKLRENLPEMGKKYGFSTEVVENTFRATGSLEKTHEILRELNRVMRGAQQALFDQRPHLRRSGEEDDDDDEDQLIPDGLVPPNASPTRKEKERGERTSGSSIKRNRPSLNYKLITTDETEMSDYSPPSKTRAYRYTKLQREGREEEALQAAVGRCHLSRTEGNFTLPRPSSREASLESVEGEEVGGNSEIQRHPKAPRRGMDSPPPDMEASPSPVPKTVLKQTISQEEDDGRADEVDHLADGDDDQHSVVNAEDDQNEYKKLALEVTLQDQEAMLTLERATDGALLQQWSLELIEERLAAARKVLDARVRQEDDKAAMG